VGIHAVGAYLHQLREERRLTATDVVALIAASTDMGQSRPNQSYISRLERGEIGGPGLVPVAAINRALGGNPAHIDHLLFAPATPDEGRQLAHEWLALSDAERERIAVLMSAPLGAIREVLRRLRSLLEERPAEPPELPPELRKFTETPEGRRALLKALEDVGKRPPKDR
jgi:transcriptional regulator with XRE-family HTH domain